MKAKRITFGVEDGPSPKTIANVLDAEGRLLNQVVVGDPMDTAEHLARLAVAASGLTPKQQERQIKAIRKAMGYSYP